MEIKSLENTGFETLFRAFSRSFADYEIQINAEELKSILKRRGFNPGMAFATITSPEVKNLTKGKGFKSNQSVFEDIMTSGFKGDISPYQQALDYFGFEGTFDPLHKGVISTGASGITDPKTGEIFYNISAFKDYNTLNYTAAHELGHSIRVKSGVNIGKTLSGGHMAQEEFMVYKGNYENSGLFKGLKLDNSTGNPFKYRLQSYMWATWGYKPEFHVNYEFTKWKNFIYNIPRRW